MENKGKLLGQILIEKGLITESQLKDALEEQRGSREFLGAILLKKGQLKEKDLLMVLSEKFAIPLTTLKNKYIDWGLVKQFSASLVMDYRCFPVKKDERAITFAITNPLDARVLAKAEEEAKGLKVNWVLVLEDDINDVVKRYQEHLRGNISNLFK